MAELATLQKFKYVHCFLGQVHTQTLRKIQTTQLSTGLV